MASNLDQYRDRIEKLYLDEKKPLKDVMEILAAEGCDASRNMYLKKITVWGLKKYRKHPAQKSASENIFSMLDKVEQHVIGPFQVFPLQDRQITTDQVLKHFQQRVNSANSPQRTLQLPDGQKSYQLLLQLTHSFQSWSLHFITEEVRNTPEVSYLNQQVYQDFQIGAHLILGDGKPKLGGALIERGFHGVKRSIELGHYKLIMNLMNLVVLLGTEQDPFIAEMLARYMFQATKAHYGSLHVFTKAMGMLYQHWSSTNVIVMVLQVCHDVTAAIMGKYAYQTLEARYKILSVYPYRSPPPTHEQIMEVYESLISDCVHGGQRKRALDVKEAYGFYFVRRGELHRGLEILNEIVDIVRQGPVVYEDHIAFHASMVVVDTLMKLGVLEASVQGEQAFVQRYLEAESLIKLTVSRAIEQFGAEHPTSINVVRFLGDAYMEYGPRYEAQLLAQQQTEQQAEQQFSYLEKALEQFTLSE